MPGQYEAVKPRIYTTRRGLDTVKRQTRPATMYDQPSPPSTDTTLGVLTPGEYVLPRWLVDDIQAGQPPHPGPTPAHMMHGGEVPGYQFGGPIRDPSYRQPTIRSSNPDSVPGQPRGQPPASIARSTPGGAPGLAPARPPALAALSSPPGPPSPGTVGTLTRNRPLPGRSAGTGAAGGTSGYRSTVEPSRLPVKPGYQRAGAWTDPRYPHTRASMQGSIAPVHTQQGEWRYRGGGFTSPADRGRPGSDYERGFGEMDRERERSAQEQGRRGDPDYDRRAQEQQQAGYDHAARQHEEAARSEHDRRQKEYEDWLAKIRGLVPGFQFGGGVEDKRKPQDPLSPVPQMQAATPALTAPVAPFAQQGVAAKAGQVVPSGPPVRGAPVLPDPVPPAPREYVEPGRETPEEQQARSRRRSREGSRQSTASTAETVLGGVLGGTAAVGLGLPFVGEALGAEYFPKAVDEVEGWIDEDEANEKRREDEVASAKAEAVRLAQEEEQKAIDKQAAAQAYLDQAMAEPVPMYSEEDYAREEAEITKAARKAMGDALIMAGEQASAMGLPVGTAQAAQANVTADVSAKQSLAKAHRFAQMRVQNMEHLLQQYNNKHRALLVSAGMEQDASRRAELFRQASILQQMGVSTSKELNTFLAELNERSWWEKALDPVGAFAGQFAGEAGGEMGKKAVSAWFTGGAA